MLIVTEATIANRGVLETRSLPRKFFGRVQLLPRGAGPGLWLPADRGNPGAALPVCAGALRRPSACVARHGRADHAGPRWSWFVIALVEMKGLRLSKGARLRAVTEGRGGPAASTPLALPRQGPPAPHRRPPTRWPRARCGWWWRQSKLPRTRPLDAWSVTTETPETRIVGARPPPPQGSAVIAGLSMPDPGTETRPAGRQHNANEPLHPRHPRQEARAVPSPCAAGGAAGKPGARHEA